MLNNRRRILRRGLPYGQAPAQGDDSDEHGIVLMANCASLFRQFEFVQQQWLQYGLDFNAGNDTCPIVGNHFDGQQVRHRRRPGLRQAALHRAPTCRNSWRRAAASTSSCPSMTALRMIAQGLVDPT